MWWQRSCVDALAEDGGADADGGGALFDGDAEVVGHAHGELGECGVFGLDFVAKAAVVCEVRACSFGAFRRVVTPGWDGHETTQREVFEWCELGNEFWKLFRCNAVLGVFGGELDLDEDGEGFIEGGGGAVEALGGFEG